MWSTRWLNDMDPCPRFATPSVPTRRDTRLAGDPHLSRPSFGIIPEPRAAGGMLFTDLIVLVVCDIDRLCEFP